MTRSDTTSELISQQVRRKEKRIVAVLGDTASGKTCLVKHMMEQDATASLAHHISTIDESHYTMKRMADGVHEQIQLIDTAPWMEFPVMHRLYITSAHVVMIVYDVTSKSWKESLTNKINQVREIKANADIMIVGTHSDKTNTLMNCTPAHVQQVIGRIPHTYTSSQTGFGVALLWHRLLHNKSALTAGHLLSISEKDICHRKRSNTSSHSGLQRSQSFRKILRKTSSLFLCTSKYQTM